MKNLHSIELGSDPFPGWYHFSLPDTVTEPATILAYEPHLIDYDVPSAHYFKRLTEITSEYSDDDMTGYDLQCATASEWFTSRGLIPLQPPTDNQPLLCESCTRLGAPLPPRYNSDA